MVFRIAHVMVLAFILATQGAVAQEDVPGWKAFVTSDFKGALAQGIEADTTESLVLACRSASILGGYMTSGKEAVGYLHQAIPLCEKALRRDPQHMIGRMTYALLLSFESKRTTKPSLAKAALRHLEYVRGRYPNVAMAHAAVAGWHSEVHAAGFLARLALGPSLKKAREGYAAAIDRGVTNLPLLIEYAKHLARGDKEERLEAQKVLQQIITAEPLEGFDRIVQERAGRLLDAVKSDKKKAIRKAIVAIGAFDRIEKQSKIKDIKIAFDGKKPIVMAETSN